MFIAQPPLYRVKKGNSERYIKDEKALTEYLLETGLNQINIKTLKGPFEVERLKKFVFNGQKFYQLLRTLSSEYDSQALTYLIQNRVKVQEVLKSEKETKELFEKMVEWLTKKSQQPATSASFVTEKDEEHSCSKVVVSTTRHAQKFKSTFDFQMASSSEYMELVSLWNLMDEVTSLPIQVETDNTKEIFETYEQFLTFLVENSKKGLYVQRYKGLGEMNPEQLWETTLNPQNRILLQVNISDAISADETFSVLMGEQVEPRRKFIEDNALSVRELDV